jgi:hypothetical protein
MFVAGLVPLPAIGVVALRGLLATQAATPLGDNWAWMMLIGLHLVVDGGLLYLAAAGICRVLFALCPRGVAVGAVALLVVAQVVASFFPVYFLDQMESSARYTFWEAIMLANRPITP